jgi:hypothetical protein
LYLTHPFGYWVARMGERDHTEPGRYPPDRYEPMPGIADLPGWIWRRMGRGVRIGLAVGLVALAAVGVALVPGIRESQEERERAEQRERAESRAELARRLEAEQRPRFGRAAVAPAGAGTEERLAARAALMDGMSAAILDDARRRVRTGALDGPILRVECEPFPRSVDAVGADEDLTRRRGRYSCLAVTAEFERSEESIGGLIGHQYRTQADFGSGRYAYCKVAGQSGPSREQLATTPRVCGG